ncbi:MAG: SpoIIE family protein phosphatase, partial [Ignavibacteria bacterium]|nr:SpoIIE family protein phosphatase [Ignavibacteria bacterium]
SVTIHENDSDKRDGSIQWSVGMADEVWNTPQLLGTAEFLPDHRMKLIRENTIDPSVFRSKTYLCGAKFRTLRDKDVKLENWRYHAGDNPEWADPLYDDRSWEITYPTIEEGRSPTKDWQGIGWFRITIAVDSSVQGVPLELRMRQMGASEIFLDGELLYAFGTVASSKDSERTYLIRDPRPMTFRESGTHLLAVRYSNFMTDELRHFGANSGFDCRLVADLDLAITERGRHVRALSLYQGVFTVIPLLLMLLHLFLFLFHRHARENLYFSAFMLFWAILAFGDFQKPFLTTLPEALLYARIGLFAIAPAVVFGLLTMYTSVLSRVPKQFVLFATVGIFITIAGFIWPGERPVVYAYYILIGLTVMETFRLFITAGRERWRQRWITFIGYSVFMVALTYQILSGLGTVPGVGEYGVIYPYGLLILSMAVSVDLSRNFARTTKELRQKLIQVEELSHKTLEQERRAKEEEVARKVLEADNARKTHELEEARNLQLSMLPRSIPSVPHLDIGVYMQPATEVGGDYYDFHRSKDGVLTVAVGDATGHGMRAGTMVAAIKGMFCALGGRLAILPFLEECTQAIKEMHLGNLYMALMVARIHHNRMIVASAGMPPMYIFRSADRRVERVVLKGMPLGAHVGFPYAEWETTLAPGDTVLMMSDGFPELFNDHDECLDYQRVQPLFEEIADRTPNEIIAHLKTAGETWMNGNHQNDDITFVVLKVHDSDSTAD